MKLSCDKGFTMLELLIVLAIVAIIALIGWQVLEGWRERNAIKMVSQDIKHLFERYRQKAIDKGYNYGLVFSDDGIYVFEDNGGSGADRFQKMNNFAIDPGEYSDMVDAGAGGGRGSRRVSSPTNEFRLFTREDPAGHLMVMTTSDLALDSTRGTRAYEADGTDISSSAIQNYTGSTDSPFEGGAMVLFFCPDGLVYLKDPNTTATLLNRYQFRLGSGPDAFYVVRIAYDSDLTGHAEVPYYYEVAINRYGAATYVRWQTYDGGSSWSAEIE